jgi:hypothetical protein
MKLAIMQPYLFPYLGYYQLVAAVDKFVFYDDVNFINRGWINRNRILLNGEAFYITVPLAGASQCKKINEISVHNEGRWRKKMLESIRHSYAKAPHFDSVNPIISDIFLANDSHISRLAIRSVTTMSDYLGLKTEFVMSSSIYKNADLKGDNRILDICGREKTTFYYNLPGGRDLYDKNIFESRGVCLRFMIPRLQEYKQFSGSFCPGLSIIDVLMFNDRSAVVEMLKAEVSE